MASGKCPRCNVIVEIRAVLTQGIVYIREISATREVFAEFPAAVRYDGGISQPGYIVALCGNCQARFIVEEEDYYHQRVVWPLPNVALDQNIPESLREAVVDAQKAHSIGAELAALMAARTALIRLQREQEVQSIKELVDAGKLTATLYAQADEVRLWANIQGHEDVEPGSIDSEDVEELLSYLQAVLQVLYIEPNRLRKRQEKRKNLK